MNYLKHLRHAIVIVVLIVAPHGAGAYAAIAIADYFPTGVGLQWNYTGTVSRSSFGTISPVNLTIETTVNHTLHSTNTTRFDIQTDLPVSLDEGGRLFLSITGAGLNLHREDFNNNDSVTGFELYDNPLNITPAMIEVGDTFMASETYQGQGWSGTANLTVDINGFEQVVTPLATYQALKVTVNNIWNDNDPENGTTTMILWLVKGLGRVRIDEAFQDFDGGVLVGSGSSSFLLTSTNIVVPEPTSLALLGLGVLGMATRRRAA